MEMAGEMGQDRSEPLPHPAALVRMVRDLVAMGISLGTSRKLAAFCSSSMATKSQSSGSLLERAARSGAPHNPIKDYQRLSKRIVITTKKKQEN
jgi:hypothetical protein